MGHAARKCPLIQATGNLFLVVALPLPVHVVWNVVAWIGIPRSQTKSATLQKLADKLQCPEFLALSPCRTKIVGRNAYKARPLEGLHTARQRDAFGALDV